MKTTPLAAFRARSLFSAAGAALRAPRRSRTSPLGPSMEPLETRTLLAAVSWDGDAGDNLWTTPSNWSNNAVPGAADDVTINVAANPTIQFTSSVRTINSLLTRENLSFEGGSLTVNTTAQIDGATVTLQAGTLDGGTYSYLNNGKLAFTSSGGTLNNVAVNGEIKLDTTSAVVTLSGTTSFTTARLQANGAAVYLAPGYTLTSMISAEGADPGLRYVVLAYGGAGTVTIAPTGVIKLASGAGAGLYVSNSSPGTLVNNGILSAEAAGQTMYIYNSTLTNNKTVQAIAGTLDIATTNMSASAAGNFAAATGSTLTLGATSWSNSAPIAINDATLNLGGNFSTSGINIPGFTRSGGTVNITGTLTNTAAVLPLTAATGSWTLRGGTITGGSVTYAGGARLSFSSSGGILSNLAVAGDLIFDDTSAYASIAGSTSFTAARLQANGSGLYIAPGYVLSSLISVEGPDVGQRYLVLAWGGAGNFTVSPTGIIRLAANAGGGVYISDSSPSALINNGLISAEAADQTLSIQNSSLVNNKTVQSLAGALSITSTTMSTSGPAAFIASSGSTLTLGAGSWSNVGTLTINNATLNLGGGFTTSGFNLASFSRTAGTVNLTGTLTNTAAILPLSAATGSWNLLGGAIIGGSVTQTGGARLVITSSAGTLTNVAFAQDLIVDATSAYAILAGNTTFPAARLQANGSGFYLAPGYTLSSLISIEGAEAGQRYLIAGYGGAGNFTISPTGIIRLAANAGGGVYIYDSSPATLINNGLISAEAPDHILSMQNSLFINNKTAQVLAGTLSIAGTSMTTTAPASFSAAPGSILTLAATTWSNVGTLTINNATLNLGGGFSTSGFNFAGFSRTAGTVNLTGILTNTAAVLPLTAATGNWTLLGGTINNGSVTYVGGSRLTFTTSAGTLNNVAVAGDLIFDIVSSYAFITGNTTFTAIRLQANNSGLYFAPNYTLSSLISIEGPDIGQRFLVMAYGGSGSFTIAPTGTIRLAPGAGGGFYTTDSSPSTLINNGLISAEATDQVLSIQNSFFVNNVGRTIQSMAGNLSVAAASYTNSGTFKVANAATLSLGGNFNTSGGIGTFINNGTGLTRVVGTVTNVGNSINLNAATGSWTMFGGTINDGSITLANGTAVLTSSSGGTLNNVAIAGEIQMLDNSAHVIITGTTTFNAARLNASGSALYLPPGYTLDSLVTADGPDAGGRSIVLAYGGEGTNTFAASTIVRLLPTSGGSLYITNSSAATLINNGLIQGQAINQYLGIQPSIFTNNGTVDGAGSEVLLYGSTLTNIAAGVLSGGVWMASNGGALTGQANLIQIMDADVSLEGASKGWDALNTLESVAPGRTFTLTGGTDQSVTPASGTFTNEGTIILGLGSRLFITGNFVQTAAGTLQVHIAGGDPDATYGSINATGTGSLAGTLNIIAVNGYDPSRPDVQDVIKTVGPCSGTFSTATYPTTTNPEWETYFYYTANGVQLITTSIIDFNVDGLIDLLDFFEFFNRWDVQDPSLDLNNDGSVDLGDYFLFFNLFDQG